MATGSSMTAQGIRISMLSFLLLALTARINGLAISYCSPDNTAGGFQAVYKQFQTNDLCQQTCQDSYAYAVLQGPNCWCSNYAPADQVSTYSCNTVCPGWQDEWCGSTTENLYGYYALSVAPSGTAGGSGSSSGSPSPSSASSSSSSPVSNTPISAGPSIVAPWTSSSFGGYSPLTTSSALQSSSQASKPVAPAASSSVLETVTSSTSSSPSTTVTSAATPTQVYTSVTTVTGQAKTILVTPTATPSTDATLGSGTTIKSSGGGVSTGTVVGIVIGVALGLGLIIGLGVFYWLRKRHRRNLQPSGVDGASSSGNTGIPSRQVSQLSSAGLLGKAPRIQTSGLPFGNHPRSADTHGSGYDRRSLGTDQRLNPYAIYAHDESRHSNVSLQDNQDYSRQLRVANPDP